MVREPKSYMDMVIPCLDLNSKCIDYRKRKRVEYMTGETPAWKRKGMQKHARYSQALWKHKDAAGVAAGHLDWTMVPYVRKSFYKHYCDGVKYMADNDKGLLEGINNTTPILEYNVIGNVAVYEYAMDMTKRELRQAVEGMYHNLNTLQSRSGNQLPFSSINYGTCTLPEGRMVTKYLLECLIDGVGKLHRTSIFPCGIFQYMKGVNDEEGTPNYDLFRLALKATALRLYPNYANVDWSGNAGYDPNDPKTYFATINLVA